MMKIVAAEDDFNAQKNFIGALHRFVQDSGVHVHLVHHSRKPDGHDGERRIPGRYDLKGSGAISDQADNVFCMWLDKTAINQQRQGNEDEPGKPHAILAVHKQRHGEFEGRVALWFDPGSMQFRAAPNAKPLEYLR
jgi:twinkle protein